MMTSEQIKSKLTVITELIHQVLTETKEVSFNDFRGDEMLKERVFSQIQEIGQIAFELSSQMNEYDHSKELIENLSRFKNARYNHFVEIDLNAVWGIIKNDFENIERELTLTVKN